MNWSRSWPPILALGSLLLMFEVGTSLGWINPALVPPPHTIWNALKEQPEDFIQATKETAFATTVGFFFAAVGGFVLAFIFSWITVLRRAILPFAIFFQTVPIIAIAPLLVIYFGFGWQTVVAASAVVAVFPVLANTLLGLESTDPGYIEMAKIYGASSWQMLWKIRLPLAYASLYSGLKVAAGLSVIGAVAGEFVAGGGLGAMIDSARTQQRIDIVFAALILLSLLGLALIALLRGVNKAVNRYRPYALYLKDE